MPLIHLQKMAKLPELGRLRIGYSVPGAKGGKSPKKSDVWRMTSSFPELLEAAAKEFGGKVQPWADHPGEFVLVTSVRDLPCWVLPIEPSQWAEYWDAGECVRRCDGETCRVRRQGPNGAYTEKVACLGCFDEGGSPVPAASRCKSITRISVMLPMIPGLGVWRLDTTSFYSGIEVPSTVEWVQRSGRLVVDGLLSITTRRVRRDGVTKVFPVPVLRVVGAGATVLSALSGGSSAAPSLPAGVRSLSAQAGAIFGDPEDAEVVHGELVPEPILEADVLAVLARHEVTGPGPIGYVRSLDVPSLDELEAMLVRLSSLNGAPAAAGIRLMNARSAGVRSWENLLAWAGANP